MTKGKITDAELAAAATELQHRFDGSVKSIEIWLRTPVLEPEPDRRAMRAKLAVYDRLSKTLARIIANGTPAHAMIADGAMDGSREGDSA